MARPFLIDFVLPLVKGGALHVGRPLGMRALERIARAAPIAPDPDVTDEPAAASRPAPSPADLRAGSELARARRSQISRLLPYADEPPLDWTSLRLGAAVHNLLALGHPEIAGRGLESRQERIAAAALELASVGAPTSMVDAVNRHSLLARLPDIARSDRTVHFWVGRRTFVGRVPPRRLTALPKLRNVRVDLVRRAWLREIGIPGPGRAAFLALNIASPLGEALDPLRLDPPMSWSRILPVLRFPELCRAVAGRALELGVRQSGEAFADALFRFASMQEPPGGLRVTADGVRFAIRFLAHLVWLDVLFAPASAAGSSSPSASSPFSSSFSSPSSSSSSSSSWSPSAFSPLSADSTADAGLDLPTVLVAAHRTSDALVWPPDVPRDGDLGRAFQVRLDAMAARVHQHRPPRLDAALSIAELAAARPTSPSISTR
jgi:hypothetical protein